MRLKNIFQEKTSVHFYVMKTMKQFEKTNLTHILTNKINKLK